MRLTQLNFFQHIERLPPPLFDRKDRPVFARYLEDGGRSKLQIAVWDQRVVKEFELTIKHIGRVL